MRVADHIITMLRWPLNDPQLLSLLKQTADGSTFNDPPQLYFGGTAISYASVFGMYRLLKHIFQVWSLGCVVAWSLDCVLA
jgi:hypothetical protein